MGLNTTGNFKKQTMCYFSSGNICRLLWEEKRGCWKSQYRDFWTQYI